MTRLKPSGSMTPGDGERAAQRGFGVQYDFAVALLLDSLVARTLDDVYLADPEAGTLDDLQIGTANELRAYQFKSSDKPDATLSWTDFREELPALAHGWLQIRDREALRGRTITSHLVTTMPAASKRTIEPANASGEANTTFADFLRDVWHRVNSRDIDSQTAIPRRFVSAWRELNAAVELSEAEFFEFARSLRVQCATPRPDFKNTNSVFSPDAEEVGDRLRTVIQQVVRSEDRTVRLTSHELIERLGWSTAFTPFVRHQLEIDRSLYAQNSALAEALRVAISDHSSGYLALIGGPGTGKSYLLADVLGHTDEIFIQYYAYLPGSRENAALRVAAKTFLHDLVVQLEDAGLVVGRTPAPDSLEALQARLGAQLQRASDQASPVTILIDGLDYVGRIAGDHAENLLAHLPTAPLPEGVRVVLGTQHLEGVDPSIRAELRDGGRTVRMRPLSDTTIESVCSESGHGFTPSETTAIISRSAGHPLALGMLLRGAISQEPSHRLTWLSEQPSAIDGDVGPVYEAYWKEISKESALVHQLAKMARWRTGIDPIWIAHDHSEVLQMLRPFTHLFRREDEARWFFFHESFRLFLVTETIRGSDGSLDESLGRLYSKELAERCASADPEDPKGFEELHHRLRAEDWDRALELATPNQIRTQLKHMRSPRAALRDVRAATEALRESPNLLSLAQLCISATELEGRSYHADIAEPLPPFMIRAGLATTAIDWLRTDIELLDGRVSALRSCRDLLNAGQGEEARRLFALASPRDLLSGHIGNNRTLGEPSEALAAWAEVVNEFVEVERIAEIVRGLSTDSFEANQPDQLPLLKAELCWRIANNIQSAGNEKDADLLIASMGDDEYARAFRWRHKVWCAHREGDTDELRELADHEIPVAPDCDFRIDLIEALILLGASDAALPLAKLLADVPLPAPYYGSNGPLAVFRPIMRVARVRSALGEPQATPSRSLHRSEEGRYIAWYQGVESLIRMAVLEGRLLSGQNVSVKALTEEIGKLDSSTRVRRRISYGIESLRAARTELICELLERLTRRSQNNDEFAAWLLNRYDGTGEKYWHSEARAVIPALFRHGLIDQDSARSVLLLVDSELHGNLDAASSVEAWALQADAWVAIGEKDRAKACLVHATNSTFAVGFRKDSQLVTWLKLCGDKLSGSGAPDFAAWVCAGLVGLEETTEGDAGRWAAHELLSKLSSHPDVLAGAATYLQSNGVISSDEALANALTALGPCDDGIDWIGLECLASSSGVVLSSPLAPILESVSATERANRLATLVGAIDVHAIPSLRDEWKDALVVYEEEQGDSTGDAPAGPPADPEKPHAKATADIDLLGSDANEAIDDVAPTLTIGALLELSARIRSEGANVRLLAPICERLLQLGSRPLAAEVAMEVIEDGEPFQWLTYWGGAKIRAAKVLVKANGPAGAAPSLFQQICDDFDAEPYLLSSFASTLPPIVSLLNQGSDPTEVEAEVVQFMHDLLAPVMVDYAPEFDPSIRSGEDAIRRLLCERAVTDYSVRGAAAKRACRDALRNGNEGVLIDLLAQSSMDISDAKLIARAVPMLPTTNQLEIAASRIEDEWVEAELAAWGETDNRGQVESHDDFAARIPVRRPPEVERIGTPDSERWISGAAFADSFGSASHLCVDAVQNWTVLAEDSTFKKLSWEAPTETRKSSISLNAESELFLSPTTRRWTTADPLVVATRAQALDGDLTELGLHSDLVQRFGLKYDHSNREWQDSDSKTAMKAVWWRDGALSNEPPGPKYDDEVCEGTLLLASEDFVKSMEIALGEIHRRYRGARYYEHSEVASSDESFTLASRSSS